MSDTIPQVTVNQAEYAKFVYLMKVRDAVDRAHSVVLRTVKTVKETDGIRSYMDFDWRGVSNFISPQLHLVFLQDAERNKYQQSFMEYPIVAIVARTAQIVELDDVFELNLEGSDLHPEVDEVMNAFRILEAAVRAQPGSRRDNAEKTLSQLGRVLRLEL